MNKFMLSLIALCAFAHTAHANDFDGYQSEESAYSQESEMSQDEAAMMSDDVAAYGRGGGRGDGRGPGRGGPGWGRPDYGPGHGGPRPRPYPPGHGGPGHGGPGYPPPGHGGPGHGGPGYPHPGPGYPPPPPHQPSVEYVTCESYGNRYNTCYVNPYGIRRVYLARQISNTRCDANRTFGLSGNYIWVDRGCRGVFAVERY
ncbi:hypothetical protein DOM22_15220 [Bdellovibrio sp. ZAP7]|uniref:DUF3011 domain-containing protein n=1 Tax=Bdellovibrio sp. ZAP7 TaxID=2231053 RepID=UPI001164C422|nr:DUF3011 domain-containing protein [Bdellovibrio sp. ZAP7]QDK46419.1 hypothetical protein DOM22_15220 [Bdellovibrio sp. ZAP7]